MGTFSYPEQIRIAAESPANPPFFLRQIQSSMISSRFQRITRRLFIPSLLCTVLLPSCSLLGLGMMKLRFGCLPEGTRIDTPSATVAIEDLKSGDQVIGFNGSEVQITQIHQYQEDPATSQYLALHFTDGTTVSASPRHRIDGIPASAYKPGDRVGAETVISIETIRGVSRSFDLLTGDKGYRIGGLPVNSMIVEMAGR
jgi:hypothetical protein